MHDTLTQSDRERRSPPLQAGDAENLQPNRAQGYLHSEAQGSPPLSGMWVFCLMVFALGVLLRALYIFKWNHPYRHLFSDMKAYDDYARQFCDPNHIDGLVETIHPPGSRFLFGGLRWLELQLHPGLEPSMYTLGILQFVLCVLVPVLLAWIAWDLFGPRCCQFVLAAASLYYPLFDYFGFMLSEGPFTFCMLCSFWLLIRAMRVHDGLHQGLLALAGGIFLGLSGSLKTVAMVAAFFVLLAMLIYIYTRGLRAKRVVAASILGFLIVLTPLTYRATKLSGRFCVMANDAARNIVLGHHGNILGAEFYDEHTVFIYASPSAAQKNYTEIVKIPIGVYDNKKLMAYAWDWIKAHPAESIMLSFIHMFDLFWGTYPWPSICFKDRDHIVIMFCYIFLLFILFPAIMHVARNVRGFLTLKPELAGDWFVLLPVLAIAFAAFIALGEPRYRIPFDGFLLLLAARAYCGMESKLLPFKM